MGDSSSPSEPVNQEWLRNKLGVLWTAPHHCGFCLETKGNLFPFKLEFMINGCSPTRTLKEITNTILNCNIEDYASSDMICEHCIEKAIQSYIFIEDTKKVFKILNGCVNDLLSKVTDLNNEFGENEMYKDSNVMIVIEHGNEIAENITKNIHQFNTSLIDQVKKDQEETPKKLDISVVQNKENKPVPTLRVIKHPRIKEVVKEKEAESTKAEMPTFSLEGGKIVIAPLTTNSTSAPKYNTYTCNSCSNIFTTYRALKEHEKSKHNTTIYQCRFCSKMYNSQQYLDVHYLHNHSKSRCKCCHDLIDTKELNDHLRLNHANQVSICIYCDLAYYTIEQLGTHYKSTHLANNKQAKSTSIHQSKNQCIMCLKNVSDAEIKIHKCKFSCLECLSTPCVHYSYLMSYREQILSHATKIKCIDCDFTTKRKEHLIAHVNREHLDHHPFTCNDCGTQFYTKLSLKSHIVQFHQDLKCQYCDHEFRNMMLLQRHRELCKDIARSNPCKLCVASFNTDSELKKHTNLNHSDIVYPCMLCKKEFTHPAALKVHHMRIHTGIQHKKRRKFIECTLCDITFNNIKEMEQHEELHSENETYPCKVCTKTFSSLRKLCIHKQKHYSPRTKCPHCQKYVGTAFFDQHTEVCTRFKTNGLTNYECDICGKGLSSESTLQTHQQVHAKAVPCTSCHKLIKPLSLKKHMETKHSSENELEKAIFACEFCNYKTKKRIHCENHVNKMHLKIKPFVCEICNKSFCGKARLDEHMRTHSDNNICYCSFCGKKFANKVCLKMHTRRHTGEKPYECNICQERFRSSSIMKTHRLKKHQDKTIQCPLCDSMFHLVAEMRFHVKKVHWKRPDPFDFKQIVSEEFYHLFEDRRLQKLGLSA